MTTSLEINGNKMERYEINLINSVCQLCERKDFPSHSFVWYMELMCNTWDGEKFIAWRIPQHNPLYIYTHTHTHKIYNLKLKTTWKKLRKLNIQEIKQYIIVVINRFYLSLNTLLEQVHTNHMDQTRTEYDELENIIWECLKAGH